MIKIMLGRTFAKRMDESYVKGQESDAKKLDMPLNITGDLTLVADAFFIYASINVGGDLTLTPRTSIIGRCCSPSGVEEK